MTIRLIIIMGVSGAGKSTIAKALAKSLDGKYLDADDFHPKSNIDKMSQGIPLDDTDRWPWLEAYGENIATQKGIVIGACSALTKAYRQHLIGSAEEPILFINLLGTKELIYNRIANRKGHFMPPSQLESQLETLEIPGDDELAFNVDISASKSKVINQILQKIDTLNLQKNLKSK